MDIKTYIRQATPTEREAFANALGTSVGYLYQMSGGHKLPSPKRAQAMVAYDPTLTLHELRPDIWQAPESSPSTTTS